VTAGDDGLTSHEEAVAASCGELVEKIGMLRAVGLPPADADPTAVHAALLDVRARLDLAEPLRAEMIRRRRMAARVAARRGEEADDAYDAALVKTSGQAMRREYESVRDREVVARTQGSPARRAARQAEAALAVVKEAEELVNLAYFGLLNVREELLARLRYLPWETNLER
jgi:hypothetical protein